VTFCEIHDGRTGILVGFSQSFFGFLPLISVTASELSDSPDQAPLYHILGRKFSGVGLHSTLGWLHRKEVASFCRPLKLSGP
jgi:hypothetical protein